MEPLTTMHRTNSRRGEIFNFTRWSARCVALGGALALSAAVLALGGAAPAMAAPVLIQYCTPAFAITKPGVYVLARDLNCPGDGIIISADDVRLFLGGHTLSGNGSGIGIVASGSEEDPITGLRVHHGSVTRFGFGLVLRNAPGARISGMTATDSVDDGDGIAVRNSPGARVLGNTFTRNGGDGIDLAGCNECEVIANRAIENGDTGIEIESLTSARIAANTATGNGDDGIDMQGTEADGNRIQGNKTTGNADNGIVVDAGSTGNRFGGNTATGNASLDLEDVNLPASPCPNTWRNNRFATDNEAGVVPRARCIR